MLAADKYAQVNDDTRAGVGIPEVLLNGTAGNFSNSFLAIKTLLERLKTGRMKLLHLIQDDMEMVAKALGFQKSAWVKMKSMSLNDEEVERRFLLELIDRNVMSSRTLIEHAGENFDIELQRMKEEDEIRKDIIDDSPFALRKMGKFGPQLQDDTLIFADEEDMPAMRKPKQDELPTAQEDNGRNGGRPRGDKRKRSETTPRSPRGEGLAAMELRRQADYKFQKLFDIFTSNSHKSNNSKKLAKLRDIASSNVYDAILKSICHLDGLERITIQQISDVLNDKNLTESGAKLERCVRSVVRDRVAKFRKKNGKTPSEKKMKDINSSAFAICKSQGLK
ncbi:MAG: hypothetical protein ACXAB7_22910 [Candidatus Kariarchaeaceae archaeon]|jgi:hypothetical protein